MYILRTKMDCMKINEDICRICLDYLDHNIILNWDEEIFEFCGISYKDCYYKYTQLEETDADFYPTNLCEMCADELKNAYFLIEKALESYSILQDTVTSKLEPKHSNLKMCNPQPKKECQIYTSSECNLSQLSEITNSRDGEKHLMELQSNVSDNENVAHSEITINNSSELSISENITMETRYFVDIQKLESCDEISLEQQLGKTNNHVLPIISSSIHSKRRNKLLTINEKFPEKEVVDNAENKSKSRVPTSQSSTTNSTIKTRKKYILICQYCSLKVNGTNHLKEHEATHNENRERNETCPQCGIKLYNKIALSEHMKIHRENRQKDHKCEFCEKAFFSKGSLNVHRRIHLGLMVKCHICSKEYCRQVDLNKHMLIHSANPIQKSIHKLKYTVQCHYCNKTVLTKRWKEHKFAHLNQPQTKCKICDKDFYSRSSCRSHIQKVHRQREFDQYIYYYVDPNIRMSHLMMVQQEKVQPLEK